MPGFHSKTCGRLLAAGAAALLYGLGAAAYAAEPRSYSSDLATLYNEYQRVLALREACTIALVSARVEVEGAYKDWETRHARLIDEMETRFAILIKRASKDQAEYTRNYGKYQSEVLALREESKRALLADRERLAGQCKELGPYLRQPQSDIPAMFPAEYRNVLRAR